MYLDTDQQQPSDGGVGGHCGNSGGHGNENSDGGGGGGSHDLPQTPSSSGGGSSSSGDNGDDDPNKKPPIHKPQEPTEVESKEEENNDDDSQSQPSCKGQMVTNPLQPPPMSHQISDPSRRHGDSVMVDQPCSNSWTSSPYKSFEHSEQLRMCPLEEKVVIHEPTNDEQLLQSAASIGEEQLNLELSSVVSATEEILDQVIQAVVLVYIKIVE